LNPFKFATFLLFCFLLPFETSAERILIEALDADHLSLSTQNNSWEIVEDEGIDGKTCIKTIKLDHSESATLQGYFNGPSNLSFSFKTSTEYDYDELVILVDGEFVESLSGEWDWTRYTLALSEGLHQVNWIYQKDEDISEGLDEVWLDSISLDSEFHQLTGLTDHDIISDGGLLVEENEGSRYEGSVYLSNSPETSNYLEIQHSGPDLLSFSSVILQEDPSSEATLYVNDKEILTINSWNDWVDYQVQLSDEVNKIRWIISDSDSQNSRLYLRDVQFNKRENSWINLQTEQNSYDQGDSIILDFNSNIPKDSPIVYYKDDSIIGSSNSITNFSIDSALVSDSGLYYASSSIDGLMIFSNAVEIIITDLNSSKRNWTIFIYANADNNLGNQLLNDLIEIQNANLGQNVNIVVQTDFDQNDPTLKLLGKRKGFSSSILNNMSRFVFSGETHSENKNFSINPTEILGESTSMDDPETLFDFLDWGGRNFSANNYGIIFWNHGNQWKGFGGDTQGGSKKLTKLLEPNEISDAVDWFLEDYNRNYVEFCIFDACLMGGIEVVNALKDKFHYMTACPGLEFGKGLDYTAFFNYLAANQEKSTANILLEELEIWNKHHDQKIDTLLKSHSLYDFSFFEEVQTQTDTFFSHLLEIEKNNRIGISKSISAAQTYGASNLNEQNKSLAYRDFGHFVKNISTLYSNNVNIAKSSEQLLSTLDSFVMGKNLGRNIHNDSLGLSMFFDLGNITNYTDTPEIFDNDSYISNFTEFAQLLEGNRTKTIPKASQQISPSSRWLDFVGGESTHLISPDEPATLNFLYEDVENVQFVDFDLEWNLGDDQILHLGTIETLVPDGNGSYELIWDGSSPFLQDEDNILLLPLWGLDEEISVSYLQLAPDGMMPTIDLVMYILTSGQDAEILGVYEDGDEWSPVANAIELSPGDRIYPYYEVEVRNGPPTDWFFEEFTLEDFFLTVGQNGINDLSVAYYMNEPDNDTQHNIQQYFFDFDGNLLLQPDEVKITIVDNLDYFPHFPVLNIRQFDDPSVYLFWETTEIISNFFLLQEKVIIGNDWLTQDPEFKFYDPELGITIGFPLYGQNHSFFRLTRDTGVTNIE